jgi:hypothetical protein
MCLAGWPLLETLWSSGSRRDPASGMLDPDRIFLLFIRDPDYQTILSLLPRKVWMYLQHQKYASHFILIKAERRIVGTKIAS